MKMTMLTSLAGPAGNASKGEVVEVVDDTHARYLKERRFVRDYDDVTDRKKYQKQETKPVLRGKPKQEDMEAVGVQVRNKGGNNR